MEISNNKLVFYGYSWDDYFYVISAKQGVLVTYRGTLDSEGLARMDEILYIDGAEKLSLIYESKELKEVRSSLKNGEKLYFSYAETDNYQEAAKKLITVLQPSFNRKVENTCEGSLVCEGSCALFPEKIVLK